MPRRRPEALRAERWRPPKHVSVHRIRGVSAQTRVAVRRVEDDLQWAPDLVFRALAVCEWALKHPGRYLDATVWDSPGIGDARDELDEIWQRLPAGARKDLGRLIQRIDAELERRTLPDPAPVSGWAVGRWWWQRIRER